MSEIFGAALMGGGSGPAFAVIDVTYPAGATITCTKGGKVLTAKDTAGHWLFPIPEAGDWVVTITQAGQEPKSETVSVTEGKAYVVELSFALYLYKEGDKLDGVGGSWETVTYFSQGVSAVYGADRATITFYGKPGSYTAQGGWYKNPDLSNFTKLCMEIDTTDYTYASNNIAIVVCNSASKNPLGNGGANNIARLNLDKATSKKTYVLDISQIQGEKFIGLGGADMGNTSYPIEVFNVYLS